MKKNFLLVLLILLTGCKKEGLDVKFRTIYKSSTNSSAILQKDRGSNNLAKSSGEYYTQFGEFIGSVTPRKVTAEFLSIRYIDQKHGSSGMQTMVELISNNWPNDDPRRLADFSNGNTVEVVPEMTGNIGSDGWFVEDNIVLRYLGIFPKNVSFEFDLPNQFNGVNIDMRNITERQGNAIRCNIDYLLYRIKDEGLDYESGIQLKGFVFGETDTCYIVSQNNIPNGDIIELISMAQPGSVARSGNYTCPVLTPPAEGGMKIITTTISFDSENLIQQYTGFDNVPYTTDDVFVLQPKFWERFEIIIDQN